MGNRTFKESRSFHPSNGRFGNRAVHTVNPQHQESVANLREFLSLSGSEDKCVRILIENEAHHDILASVSAIITEAAAAAASKCTVDFVVSSRVTMATMQRLNAFTHFSLAGVSSLMVTDAALVFTSAHHWRHFATALGSPSAPHSKYQPGRQQEELLKVLQHACEVLDFIAISLGDCDLRPMGLSSVFAALRPLHIQSVLISRQCAMTPAQAEQIGALLASFQQLQSASVTVALLSSLRKCTSLRRLDVHHSPNDHSPWVVGYGSQPVDLRDIEAVYSSLSGLEGVHLLDAPGAVISAACRGLAQLQNLQHVYMLHQFGDQPLLSVDDVNAVRQLVLANENVGVILRGVRLGQLMLEHLPPEVASLENHDVIAYWRSLRSAETVYRMKLMLVGYGEVGKTCLLRSLKKEKQPEKSLYTDGIDISQWVCRCQCSTGERVIALSCWDFAGQEAYYATHQLFLSERCLYLLVWNPRLKDARAGVEYWLKSIQMYDEKAVVFLVATRKDEQETIDTDVLDFADLEQCFPKMKLKLFHISNAPGYEDAADCHDGLAQLRRDVEEVSQKLGRIELAKSWLDFASYIHTEKSKHRSILQTSLVSSWAKEHKISAFACEAAINTLNNWGALLRYRLSAVNDVCVLEPHWLSDVARALVTAKATTIKHAVVSMDDLKHVWTGLVQDGDYLGLLELMHKFELAFQLEDGKELIPALLKEKPPVASVKGIKQLLETRAQIRMHRFELSFVPANLMIRVIFRTHKFTAKHGANVHSCWKNYVVLMKSTEGSSSDEQVATISLDDKLLTITVAGSKPNNMCSLLADMVADVLKRYPTVESQQLIVCPHCKNLWLPITAFHLSRERVSCNTCSRPLDFQDLMQCIGFNVLESMQIPQGPKPSTETALQNIQDLLTQAAKQRALGAQQTAQGLQAIKETLDGVSVFVKQYDAKFEEFSRLFHAYGADLKQAVDAEQRQQFERAAINLLLTIDKRTRAHKKMAWELDEYLTPRIVYMLPHEHRTWRGKLSPKNWIREQFDLHLMCELPGHMHVLQTKPYVVELPRDQWQRYAPILLYGLMIARVVLASVPGVGASVDAGLDLAIEMTQGFIESEQLVPDGVKLQAAAAAAAAPAAPAAAASSSPPFASIEKQGTALREFSAWMRTVDRKRTFQGLERVSLPTGEICWLCSNHAKEVNSAKVDQVVSLPDLSASSLSSGPTSTAAATTAAAAAATSSSSSTS